MMLLSNNALHWESFFEKEYNNVVKKPKIITSFDLHTYKCYELLVPNEITNLCDPWQLADLIENLHLVLYHNSDAIGNTSYMEIWMMKEYRKEEL